MPIVNRDLDASQARETYTTVLNATASSISAGILNPVVGTGATFVVANIGFPCSLVAAAEAAYTLSGTPVHSLWIYRFAGGFTSIAIGQTMSVTAFSTSGMQGFSLFGAVTYPLLSGDQLVLYAQGANTACLTTTVTTVVKALQDIKTNFGV